MVENIIYPLTNETVEQIALDAFTKMDMYHCNDKIEVRGGIDDVRVEYFSNQYSNDWHKTFQAFRLDKNSKARIWDAVYVNPDFQGKGFGRQMVSTMENTQAEPKCFSLLKTQRWLA